MIEFRPERYESRIESSKRRWEVAKRFEEPDRVPISISTATFQDLARIDNGSLPSTSQPLGWTGSTRYAPKAINGTKSMLKQRVLTNVPVSAS